jgi:signal transduction histidine kinase
MKKPRSLRFRLTAWYAAALLAGLALFSGLVWLSLRARLLGEVDEDLAERAVQFERYAAAEAREAPPERSAGEFKMELEEFCQALPAGSYLTLRGPGGFAFDYRGSRRSRDMRVFKRQIVAGNETFDLELGTSLRPIRHTLDLLALLVAGLIPLVVAIAAAGGAVLSRRALKPVDDITAAARAISVDNLALRLPSPGTGDEIQRLTEVWNSMLGRLEEAVRTLSQFAADASHELRTPLAVIRTNAEIALRRARSPESYRDSLREIEDEAARMTRLVDDLLYLARQDAQTAEMPREPLDAREVLAAAVAEVRGLAEMRHSRIRLSSDGHPSPIRANQAALRRLFLVLLDNALKYSPEGADVEAAVATEHEANPVAIVVSIKDAGPGIGAEDLPHIFKRFYQADRARTDGGFGLGLALADSIAKAHGARIEVESQEGAGSTFRAVFVKSELRGMPAAQTRDRWPNEPPSHTAEAVPNPAVRPGTGSA